MNDTTEYKAAPRVPSDFMLKKNEVAYLLRVKLRTVEKWQRKRFIPFIKIGKVVLFHWPDVVEHILANYRVLGPRAPLRKSLDTKH